MTVDEMFAYSLVGIPAWRWLAALGVAVVLFGLLLLVKRLLLQRLQHLASRTSTVLDDAVVAALAGTRRWFLALLALFAAGCTLGLPGSARASANGVLALSVIVQGGLWGHALLRSYLAHAVAARAATEPELATTLGFVGFLGRVVLWSLVVLLVLANLGVDITALVAGLGVGGIAMALAVQKLLGDLLASFSILFDKPFVVGDSIAVGDLQGKVLQVGLRTTRLRSVSGEELIISNGDLLASRIRNFKRLEERRVLFRLGLVYGTPPDALAALPAWVAEVVAAVPDARFERCHFVGFGDSALLVEVAYFVTDPEFERYMDVQHQVNLALYQALAARGLSLAFPTQTVHLSAGGS
jgi:small-conductance mechanosensitive channel